MVFGWTTVARNFRKSGVSIIGRLESAVGAAVLENWFTGEELDRGHDGSGPYRGGKYLAHDGGTRVPFVISWPGKIKPGGVSDALVGQIDFLASFAALLDIEIPEGQAKDSRNLLPVFMGESDQGVEYLLQGFKAQRALRYKNWKFSIKNTQPEQLYNLDGKECRNAGFGESNTLSSANLDRESKAIKIVTAGSAEGMDYTFSQLISLRGGHLVVNAKAETDMGELVETYLYDKQ